MILNILTSFVCSVGSSTFQKNLRVVLGANVIAQIVVFFSAPLITRLFNPSDFGLLALYLSLTSVLGAICTFRFDWLVPNAKKDLFAGALVVLGVLSLVVFTVVVSLLIIALDSQILPDSYQVL